MAFITIAGQNAIAEHQANTTALVISYFVFANIIGLGEEPSNRIELAPNPETVVYEQEVTLSAYNNADQVTYSCVMNSSAGDFDFNWVGLFSIDDILIACEHIDGLIQKRQTTSAVSGNTLVRNFGLKYTGIATTTGIDTVLESWQIDTLATLIVEPATQPEVNEGIVNNKYVAPDKLKVRLGDFLEFKTGLSSADDADLIVDSGIYGCVSGVANLPAAFAGQLTVTQKSNVIFQYYFEQFSNKQHSRVFRSGEWTAWDQLFRASDIDSASLIGEVKSGLWLNPPPNFLNLNGDEIPNGSGIVQGITYNFAVFYAYLMATIGTNILPNAQDRVIRGTSETRIVGNTEEDAIQNIVGTFTTNQSNGDASGAFISSGNFSGGGDTGARGDVYRFDASRVVRTANETRVKSVFMLTCIRYK